MTDGIEKWQQPIARALIYLALGRIIFGIMIVISVSIYAMSMRYSYSPTKKDVIDHWTGLVRHVDSR